MIGLSPTCDRIARLCAVRSYADRADQGTEIVPSSVLGLGIKLSSGSSALPNDKSGAQSSYMRTVSRRGGMVQQAAAAEGVRLLVWDLRFGCEGVGLAGQDLTVPKSPVWAGAAGALTRCAGDCLGKMPGYGACRPVGRTR